jgi:hypothetical protein
MSEWQPLEFLCLRQITSWRGWAEMRGTEPHVLASPIRLRRQSKGARHAETCHSVRKRVAKACLRCLSFQISATCGFVCSRVTAGSRRVWLSQRPVVHQGGVVSISNFPSCRNTTQSQVNDKVGTVAAELEIFFEKRSVKQGFPMLIWHGILQSQRCRTSNSHTNCPHQHS